MPTLDLIPTDLQWSGDGRALYFDTGVKGEYQIFRIEIADHRLTQVTAGARAVRSPSIAANGGMVYLVNDFTHMDDVYSSAIDGLHERKLSNHNAALWSTLALAPVQRVTYKGADGWAVDGFLVKPLNWQPGKHVSAGVEHPRRAGGTIRRRLVPRVPGLRRARVGRVLHESARVDGLRARSSSAASRTSGAARTTSTS